MYEASTVNLNHYLGTPPNTRRVGFILPDGNERSAFVHGVENDWDISIFVDETTETFFFVGTSPDKRKLRVERWLAHHCPSRKVYITKASQKIDLNGKDAGTLSHAEIADALQPMLTKNDNPQPIQKPVLELHAAIEHKTKRVETKKKGKIVKVEHTVEQKGDYNYCSPNYEKKNGKDVTEPTWYCRTRRGTILMRTKGDPTWPRTVLYNKQKTEIFFLFTKPDGNYLLEALRETYTNYQRREATASKANFADQHPAVIVLTMADNLVYDPDAFA